MNKRKIWQDLYQEMHPSKQGIPVHKVMEIVCNWEADDLVEMWANKDADETTIYIGRWRDETDEEVEKRLAEAARVKANAEKLSGSNMVVISTGEYDALKEKASKYDELCK